MLATRLNRLLTLTFSRFSGFKDMQPRILYLLQAKTGQSYTMCKLSSLSCPHSRHSCLSVCPSLCKCALRLVWPVNSPTAALSLDLFMARSSLALLGRGVSHQHFGLSATSTGSPPVTVPLFQLLLGEVFTYT